MEIDWCKDINLYITLSRNIEIPSYPISLPKNITDNDIYFPQYKINL
jgi:hypothetical protein